MAYKVLYRKYRPDNFDNVVGQGYTISMLKNAIINGNPKIINKVFLSLNIERSSFFIVIKILFLFIRNTSY